MYVYDIVFYKVLNAERRRTLGSNALSLAFSVAFCCSSSAARAWFRWSFAFRFAFIAKCGDEEVTLVGIFV